jgi:DNA-binding transcriptional ArsR family regulator
VLRALNHPVRRRILAELGDRPASARELARTLGEEVSLVAYHLNQILAQECGIVTLVETVARNGTLEKFYDLDRSTHLLLTGILALAEGEPSHQPVSAPSS